MPNTWDAADHDPTSHLAGPYGSPVNPAHALSDCVDASQSPCSGAHFPRLSLSGSGERYTRCDAHYDAYVARTQPILDDIRRRYPVCAPADFDSTYAGEVWSEDDY